MQRSHRTAPADNTAASNNRLDPEEWPTPDRKVQPESKPKRGQILRANLHQHPAAFAWRELRPQGIDPSQIEILKERKDRAVYRLAGVGPGGCAVIAKRALRAKAEKERVIYERILTRLPIVSLNYYGYVETNDKRFGWLIIDDAGRQRYSPQDEEHRILAALWLGRMHKSAAQADLEAALPDRGPDLYRAYLQSILTETPKIEVLQSLPADDQAIFKNIVSHCVHLDARWNRIKQFCDRLPRTFIHDDCLAKNVHVQSTSLGPVLAPFDWGGAGWGLPATDLGQLRLPYKGQPPRNPDLAVYHSVIRDKWPALDGPTIQRLVDLGQLFWSLKVIYRSLPEFEYNHAYLQHVTYNFRIYATILADSIRVLRWLA